MNSIDFTPLYRSSIGFDRLASLLDNSLKSNSSVSAYPPYNIEVLDENRYGITLAVAGFAESELDINVEKNVLTVRGKKEDETERQYLHQGIADRTFERKFNLADYVEVVGADLQNGLLSINLMKEIPEAMKPKTIAIGQSQNAIEHDAKNRNSAKENDKAA
jgi:molecular chaperone IbpA